MICFFCFLSCMVVVVLLFLFVGFVFVFVCVSNVGFGGIIEVGFDV